MPSIYKDKLLRIEVKKKDRCRIRIGVKEVKVVIGVRVNSKHSACEKIQQSDWVFHSSLLTLHFRQAFFTFNFSFLTHAVLGLPPTL